MANIPFVRDLAFDYGVAEQVSPLIRRVVAHNPSPYTLYGTGTYIVGHGTVAVIDPGPALPEHIEAILAALPGETVSHFLITHTHRDHSPAAAALQRATGAPTYGFGPHGGARREAGADVEEGADRDFIPDIALPDGARLEGAGWTLEAVHTPGHTSNHLCYALAEESALFTGDHVMGWSTSVIAPPDGDMAAYLNSLRRCLARGDRIYWPTHGPPVTEPSRHVAAFLTHREERERQIIACLETGIERIPAMVKRMYPHLAKPLHTAAQRSVLAHLVVLVETGVVACDGRTALRARYRLVGTRS
jgi:glyoxylase-like metal-dependent hydrolase (beta-lactamase superfamily II)